IIFSHALQSASRIERVRARGRLPCSARRGSCERSSEKGRRTLMQRPQKKTRLPRLHDRFLLGTSGLSVSPICLGITTTETVRAAFDAGINFFFVSNDLHWILYQPLMLGLDALLQSGVKRDEIVVAGVSYLSNPFFRYLQFNELLAAVPRLERIDL